MRDVAVVGFARSASAEPDPRNEVEILMPVIGEALNAAGLAKDRIGFVCSGSSDYLAGLPFSFVAALDAVGAWPPIRESHVEMDGAWALYEAWVRLQCGDVDTALVYAFGKPSNGDLLGEVLCLQLDPYYVAPLWPDAVSLAALQARALLEGSHHTERDMAEVVARSRRDAAAGGPMGSGGPPHDVEQRAAVLPRVDDLLAEPYVAAPLRRHDCPSSNDGAAAVILAAGDLARDLAERPAWISGIDHRIEPHGLGTRNLAASPSTTLAAKRAGLNGAAPDVAELHAPFSHQELILTDALGLDPSATRINPSGGALDGNPFMATGLIRVGEAAARVMAGEAGLALAHATSGPCLQQNLVCLLGGTRP